MNFLIAKFKFKFLCFSATIATATLTLSLCALGFQARKSMMSTLFHQFPSIFRNLIRPTPTKNLWDILKNKFLV